MSLKKTHPWTKFFRWWMILLAVLAIAAVPFASRLGLYDSKTKERLMSNIQEELFQIAVRQAKIVAPDYSWIVFDDEEVTPEIETYIRETVSSSLTDKEQSLARDSNLAWIVEYQGETYYNGWKDEYDSQNGIIDFSLTSTRNGVSMSGRQTPSTSFGAEKTILVNPNLVDEERMETAQGNTFSYRLALPEGFSIRFYIPQTLTANGEYLAVTIKALESRGILFDFAAGSLIAAIFIFVWKFKDEKELPMLKRFASLKLGGCLIVLFLGFMLFYVLVWWTSQNMGSGQLNNVLESIGFARRFLTLLSWICSAGCWFGWFFTVSLFALYIKYIFTGGFFRFLCNETWTAAWIEGMQNSLAQNSAPGQRRTSGYIVWPIMLLCLACIFLFCMVIYHFFGILAMAIFLVLIVLVALLLGWRLLEIQHKDYMIVRQAASQLAAGNFSDVKKQDAGQYQDLYNDLLEIGSSYQKALEDGLSSQITKTQLITNVSHDLKTPVTGIQSYSELISRSDNMEDIKTYASKLANYSARLGTLIEDLFDVAKASSGDIPLHPVTFDLTELVCQVESEWEDVLVARQLQVVMSLSDNAMIFMDPEKTMRVIDNLLSNISKYSLENSRVFITLEDMETQYLLIFKNTSRTPLDFSVDKIVERFARGDSSRTEPGSGLGLAIVKSFMEVQNARFEVRADGDLFKAILIFPKAAPEAETVHTMGESDAQMEDAGMENLQSGQSEGR